MTEVNDKRMTANEQTYLGKFEILDCLKKDKSAAVYLANHIYLGKKIILKTLETTSANQTLLDRFLREAKILAKLDHQNIIRVLDFGTTENTFYLSFEYFESKTLREIIEQNSLSDEQKNKLITQLLHALEYAHNQEIIHRDVKPENILVDNSLLLKIADFGLALSSATDNNVTSQYSIVGTPGYMSPEQIRGEKLTFQSDLFSAGTICYELYTGKNPFIGDDVSGTLNNILKFNDARLAEIISQLDEENGKIISMLLQRSINKRAKSASEVLKAFSTIETVYTAKNNFEEVIPPSKDKKKIKKSLILVSLIIFATLSLYYFASSSSPSTPVNTKNKTVKQTEKEIAQEEDKSKASETKSVDEVKISNTPVIEKSQPKTEIINTEPKSESSGFGQIFIECTPWAKVFIDSKEIETTPLKDYIMLPAGKHIVTLKHPDFPEYTFTSSITKDKKDFVKVNLRSVFGYLDFKIFPWGEVYVDDKLVGSTPFKKPIILNPGKYKISVRNRDYKTFITEADVSAGKISEVKYNFKAQIDSVKIN